MCYQWLIRRDYLQEYVKRRVKFRGRFIFADHILRTGVCNWCRGVLGEINAQTNKLIKRTALHHEEYDTKDPFRHTIELCDQCHGMESAINQGLGFVSKNNNAIVYFRQPVNSSFINRCDLDSDLLNSKIDTNEHIFRLGRICYACGSNKTALNRKDKNRNALKISTEIWHLNKPTPFVLCRACYLRIIRRAQRDRYNTYRIKYKNTSIYLGKPIRRGNCSICNKSVAKGEIKKTVLHHIQYDDTDPLAHTIELCPSCHSKQTIELEQVILPKRKNKNS